MTTDPEVPPVPVPMDPPSMYPPVLMDPPPMDPPLMYPPSMDPPPTSLSRAQTWNLFFCILAWACTISNVTLVVGTSAVVVLSIGGTTSMSSLPLGLFFMGSSFVSAAVTPWLFVQWGRQKGFLVGIGMGLVGTGLGALAVAVESPVLLMIASFFFGGATGIGFSLRFAAVELVPKAWAAKAVTLVVSGGCLAAFLGPESSRATRTLFGEDLEYMGVFLMTGIFNVANAMATMLVDFPPVVQQELPQDAAASSTDTGAVGATSTGTTTWEWSTLFQLLQTRTFLIPTLASTLCWIIMAMPMGLVRVAMNESGYTARQSLTVIELHFLSMYLPGFFVGPLLQTYGPRKVATGAAVMFAAGLATVLVAESEADGNMSRWIIGLCLLGFGWNLGFTAATVWVSNVGPDLPNTYKGLVQAAHDASFFFLSGAWIFSASYIYDAGSSEEKVLDGWQTLNYTVVGFLGCLFVVLAVDVLLEGPEETEKTKEAITSSSETNRTVSQETSQEPP